MSAPPIDFSAAERVARQTVAAQWRAEAERYEAMAAVHPEGHPDRRINLLIAKDLRDSAERLLETLQ